MNKSTEILHKIMQEVSELPAEKTTTFQEFDIIISNRGKYFFVQTGGEIHYSSKISGVKNFVRKQIKNKIAFQKLAEKRKNKWE